MSSGVKLSCARAAGEKVNRQEASKDGINSGIRRKGKDKSDSFNKETNVSIINNVDNITNNNTKHPFNKRVKNHETALISGES
ncbi:MAG: hypothetical protein P8O99_05975 [Pseudomonadales bacterium]|nr:hypothetical protein [Pseudomonadales bacterium]